MNCFYCNTKMEQRYGLYICNNNIIDNLYHSYAVETLNLKDKEFSYYLILNDKSEKNICFFVSQDCIDEDPRMLKWENYFLLEDFTILKEIKNLEQLELFINKIKVFK